MNLLWNKSLLEHSPKKMCVLIGLKLCFCNLMKHRISTSYCCYDDTSKENLYFDNQIDNFLWWNFLREIIDEKMFSQLLPVIEFEKHS